MLTLKVKSGILPAPATILTTPITILTQLAHRLLILCLMCGSSMGHAADSNLKQAWQAFQQGQTDQVILQVESLLPSLTRPDEQRDAHLLLGACAYLQGEEDRARTQIITALSFDPTYQPDSLLLAPDLQKLVATIAREHQAEIQAMATRRPPLPPDVPISSTQPIHPATPPARPASSPPLLSEAIPPLYLALIPFGVGQFANGHRTKAWTLLTVEGGLVVTSLSCMIAALSLGDSRGQYPPDTIDTARGLNVIYLVTAYTAGAVMIYGLVDGLYHRRAPMRQNRMTWVNPGRITPGGYPGASLFLTHRF